MKPANARERVNPEQLKQIKREKQNNNNESLNNNDDQQRTRSIDEVLSSYLYFSFETKLLF